MAARMATRTGVRFPSPPAPKAFGAVTPEQSVGGLCIGMLLSVPKRLLHGLILRQDENGVRSKAYVCLKRHFVTRSVAGEGVVTQLISKIRAVTLPVTIETDPPVACS